MIVRRAPDIGPCRSAPTRTRRHHVGFWGEAKFALVVRTYDTPSTSAPRNGEGDLVGFATFRWAHID